MHIFFVHMKRGDFWRKNVGILATNTYISTEYYIIPAFPIPYHSPAIILRIVMLDEITKWNASKWAVFLEYEIPHNFFSPLLLNEKYFCIPKKLQISPELNFIKHKHLIS